MNVDRFRVVKTTDLQSFLDVYQQVAVFITPNS